MSVIADVVMKRSNGIASTRPAETAAAIAAIARGTRRAPLDPGEERDAEERDDVEQVPLLDPIGELGRERSDDREHTDDQRDRRREERLQARVEGSRAHDEHDERRERDDEHVQGELRDVPPEVAEHLLRVVAPVADRGVGAEQSSREDLGDEDDDCAGGGDPVEPAVRARSSRAGSASRRPRGRAGAARIAGTSRDRLHARPVGDGDEPEQEHDEKRRGALEDAHEHEGDEEEQRVEGVLRHHRPRVRERRDGDREQRGEEREPVRHDPPCEEERGNGGQRHEQRVQRLHGRVRLRQVVEERVRRADQERIDRAVAGMRLVAEERLARRGEPARELRPDDLVDHDERCDDAPRQECAGAGGGDHDGRQPGPGRNPAERSTQARPRRGVGRSLSPRPSRPRSRRLPRQP